MEILKVVVHTINMGDVEDPDFLISWPLYEWTNTELGKWVMEHSVTQPYYQREVNPETYGWRYIIIAELSTNDYTFFNLKYK